MNKPENKLTDEQHARLEALAAMPDSEIDTSDIPEDTDWSTAERGKFLVQGEAKAAINRQQFPNWTPPKRDWKASSATPWSWTAGCQVKATIMTGAPAWTWPTWLLSLLPPSRRRQGPSHWTKTLPHEGNSWHGSKSQIDSRGIIDVLRNGESTTSSTASPFSMAHPPRGTPRLPNATA